MELAPSIAVLTDGAAGNELQALALAHALSGEPPRVWRLRARWPYSALAPRFAPVLAPSAWMPPLMQDPWPELAVGCGRMGAAALLTIARASGGRTRTLQILDPRIDTGRYDVVIAPAHDQLAGANVIAIEGSLNAIDDAWLAQQRAQAPDLGAQASPRTLLLVGGHRRGVDLALASFERLAQTMARWRALGGGSLWMIGSRRTPAAWRRRLRRLFADAQICWFDTSDGANPYRGALAWADRIICTADSVNMQSEALATGKPVFALSEGEPAGKLGRFQRAQIAAGRLRLLGSEPLEWRYTPLRELQRIVPLVRAKL